MRPKFLRYWAASKWMLRRVDRFLAASDELARMRQEAKDFRLIASQLPPESRARTRADELLSDTVVRVSRVVRGRLGG